MSDSESENIPDEEAFANGFFYFIKALKILAADADTQCARMKNYNVAKEIKDDVSAGLYLLKIPHIPMTQKEKNGISDIIAELEKISTSLLLPAKTKKANKEIMSDPFWIPLRAHAIELLNLLATAIEQNEVLLTRSHR